MLRIKYLALILIQQRSSVVENVSYNQPAVFKDVPDFHVSGIGSFSLVKGKITIRFDDTVILLYDFPQSKCTIIDVDGENSELRLEFPIGFERQVGILNQFVTWVENREAPRPAICGDDMKTVDVAGVLERNKMFLDG
jgi:hypothetical protein